MRTNTGSLGLNEIAHVLEATPALLRDLVGTLPKRALDWHPGAEKWCIKEIIGHLTEEDRWDFVGRIQVMLDREEPLLAVNDQEEVARLRHDCDKSLASLLGEFGTVRYASISVVTNLNQTQLDRSGVHPKIGRIRVVELLHEWVYRDINHIRQIGTNIQRFLWDQLGKMQQFYQH